MLDTAHSHGQVVGDAGNAGSFDARSALETLQSSGARFHDRLE
jgi:hypothetical protein